MQGLLEDAVAKVNLKVWFQSPYFWHSVQCCMRPILVISDNECRTSGFAIDAAMMRAIIAMAAKLVPVHRTAVKICEKLL